MPVALSIIGCPLRLVVMIAGQSSHVAGLPDQHHQNPQHLRKAKFFSITYHPLGAAQSWLHQRNLALIDD